MTARARSRDYGAVLIDHFDHPRNLGEVAKPDASATTRGPAGRDSLQLTFRIEAGRIADVRFRAAGCPVAIAAGSVATELLLGKTLAEALRLRDAEVIGALGGLPSAGLRRSVLVARTVAAALRPLAR